jgi:hypothetical protein
MTDQAPLVPITEKKKEEFILNEMRPCIALRLRKHPLVRIDHGVNPDTGKNIISYVFETTAKPDYDLWITGSDDGIYGPLREVFKAMDEWKQAIRSLPRK